jgi:mono/diheme cytochrome c family protein
MISRSLILLGAAAVLVAGAPARAADVARGYRLYTTVGCSLCHGTVGQGGGAAPRLAPNPMPYDALRDFVRNPLNNGPSYARMPVYPHKILPDADVADIHAYLQSIPPAKTVAQIPLLRR